MEKFSLFEKRTEALQLTDTQKKVIARIVVAATPKVAAEDISKDPNIVAARDMLIKLGVITFSEGTLAALTASGKKLATDSNIIDAAGVLTDEGNKLLATKEEEPTPESYLLIKQLITEVQKMSESVEPIKEAIKKIFPDSFISVKHDTGIMDSISLHFSVEPKEKWPNNIFHNATYVILHIDEKGKRRETGEGPYQVELTSSHVPKEIKFRKKTGNLQQIIEHIRKYFTSLKGMVK